MAEGIQKSQLDQFERDLISQLNKEAKERKSDPVAYNLSVDVAPTDVRRWISTGSLLLDYILSNRRPGGIAEGRIYEIFGPTSIGKSHLALQIGKSAQRMGGICVYIDTENATSIENLAMLGIDVKRRFVFIEQTCTEHIFSTIESVILKAREITKDVPVVVIWDSIAASSPKEELEKGYDKLTIGSQARALSKGLRKITQIIGNTKTTLVCLNQIRHKIGVMFGDPTTTPGGNALPFYSSGRMRIYGGQKIEKDGEIVGITVKVKTIKNKLTSPMRTAPFEIHFGKGIYEHAQIFDTLRLNGKVVSDGNEIDISGTGAWKKLCVSDVKTGEVVVEKKFQKNGFDKLINDPVYRPYILTALDDAMIKIFDYPDVVTEEDEEEELETVAREGDIKCALSASLKDPAA